MPIATQGGVCRRSERDQRGKVMKLVSILWPSNYPNFEADSIFVFNRMLLRHLAEFPGLDVTILGPRGMPPVAEQVSHHTIELGRNKFSVRLGFPWAEMRDALAELKPDVVFVNMPEQALALRILVREELRLNTRIVTYVHYVPGNVTEGSGDIVVEPGMDHAGGGQLILVRLLECLYASDLVLTCSNFARNTLMSMAERLFGPDQTSAPIEVLHPPIDLAEVEAAGCRDESGVARIVYNHRLYNEYGTWDIFNLLDELYDEGNSEFRVLVTNPTGARNRERDTINPQVTRNIEVLAKKPYVDLQHFDRRNDYYVALKQSVAGIAPMKANALWSMSVVDVLAVGRPVVAFNIASFSEIGLPVRDLVPDGSSFKARITQILHQSSSHQNQHVEELTNLANQYSAERVASRFNNQIMAL